jgi:hypothetical protein
VGGCGFKTPFTDLSQNLPREVLETALATVITTAGGQQKIKKKAWETFKFSLYIVPAKSHILTEHILQDVHSLRDARFSFNLSIDWIKLALASASIFFLFLQLFPDLCYCQGFGNLSRNTYC